MIGLGFVVFVKFLFKLLKNFSRYMKWLGFVVFVKFLFNFC